MSPSPLGARGERFAADELERRGWTILARNYRFGRKEVDLVARRGEVVAFIEVKARSGDGYGHPLDAVTPHKRREIAAVAEQWVALHGRPDDAYRYDAIAIHLGPDGRLAIDHIEDAWGI